MSFNFKEVLYSLKDLMAYEFMAYTLSLKAYIMVKVGIACELRLALSASSYSKSPTPKGLTKTGLRKHLWPKKALTNSQDFLGCSLEEGSTILFWVKETLFHLVTSCVQDQFG